MNTCRPVHVAAVAVCELRRVFLLFLMIVSDLTTKKDYIDMVKALHFCFGVRMARVSKFICSFDQLSYTPEKHRSDSVSLI